MNSPSDQQSVGVLLVNLGSPGSTDVKDIREYLRQLLDDPNILSMPKWMRRILLDGFILRTRPQKIKEAYDAIWTDRGSPLLNHSADQGRHLKRELEKRGWNVHVEVGMQVGTPPIRVAIETLCEKGIKTLVVLPLYPHSTVATTEATLEKVQTVMAGEFEQPVPWVAQESFGSDNSYLNALAKQVMRELFVESVDRLVLSYHSVPTRHITRSRVNRSHCQFNESCCQTLSSRNATCYRAQCFATSTGLAEKLGVSKDRVVTCFQSRFNSERWVGPFTFDILQSLPQQGVKKIAIACPSFVSDCLETLEEIQMRGQAVFRNAGGETFHYIPCLNESEEWISTMADMVEERMTERIEGNLTVRSG